MKLHGLQLPYKSLSVYLALSLILVLGTALRLQNIADLHHVDEQNIVKRAETMAAGTWHVAWYNWPAQSLMRIDAVVFWVSDLVHTTNNFNHLLLGRIVTLLFGLLTIVAVYWLGRLMHSQITGLLAALFMSISSLHVLHSQFVTPDVPFTAALVLNCIMAVYLTRSTTSGYWKYYCYSGAIVGFALATKYTGIITLLPLLFAHLIRIGNSYTSWPSRIVQFFFHPAIWLAGLTAVITHTICNPFFFTDFQQVVKSVFFEAKSNRLGASQLPPLQNFFTHIVQYLSALRVWCGSIITWLAYGTVICGLWHWRKTSWLPINLLTLVGGVTVLLLSWHGLFWSRWAVPFTPIIALLAGYGLSRSGQWCYQQWHRTWLVIVAGISVIMISIIPQVVISLVRHYQIAYSTTGRTMSEYITTHLPANSRIAADSNFITLPKSYHLQQLQIYLYDTMPTAEYVIVKPKRYTTALANPKQFHQIIDFFDALQQSGSLITRIEPTYSDILTTKKDLAFYYWLSSHDWSELTQIRRGQTLQLWAL